MQEHWSPTTDKAVNIFLTDRKANRCTLEHYQSRLGGFSRFLASQNIYHIMLRKVGA